MSKTDDGCAVSSERRILSSDQRGMYYLQQIDPNTRAFNIGAVVHFETSTNHTLYPTHFIPALKTIVSRHSALRSKVIPGNDHIPLFIVGDNEIEEHQLVSYENVNNSNWMVDQIRKPYDLTRQLFRFSIHQTNSHKLSITLSFHHLSVDGVSLHILLWELLTQLSSVTLNPNPPQLISFLPPSSSSSYEPGDSAKERKLKKYMNIFGSVKKCTQLAVQDTLVSTKLSETVVLSCPPDISDIIADISRILAVSPTVVMTMMYCIAVKKGLLKEEEEEVMVIGCGSENRRRCHRGMVGHTVSLLPLKLNLCHSLQNIVRQTVTGWSLIMEGGVSLADLLPILTCLHRNEFSEDKIYSSSPLQILFSFLPTPQNKLPRNILLSNGCQVTCSVEYPRSCDAQADLFLEVRAPGAVEEEENGCYILSWEYRPAVLNRKRVECLNNYLLHILTTCHSQLMKTAANNITYQSLVNNCSKHTILCLTLHHYTTADRLIEEEEMEEEISESDEDEVIRVRGMKGLCWLPTQQYSNSLLLQKPLLLSLIEGVQDPSSSSSSLVSPVTSFVAMATKTPHKMALKHNTEMMTYCYVMERVEQLAKLLRWKGVAPGDHVGLLIPSSPLLYIGILAILRCGAAYVPLSLYHPQSLLLNMLDSAGTKLLLTESNTLITKLPNYLNSFLSIDSILTNNIPELPNISCHGDQLAYIIFTSGTTGVPKGVTITMSSLCQFLENYNRVVSEDETEMTLAGSTVAWDAHINDSIGPLTHGSCLVIAPTLEISPGITFAVMSPSAASVIHFPDSMKCLMVGGEAFTKSCYNNIKHIPRVLNVYGPTETTVFVSFNQINTTYYHKYLSTLGLPLPGVTMMVCDEQQRPVPLGNDGELCISGSQVSKQGYFKNKVKTAEVFVSSPVAGYGLVYRTGDWTRMTEDGTIIFLGRIDDQVKLRGMRFQLHEVETQLRLHPLINMAAVAVRHSGTEAAQLVAFVTPSSLHVESLYSHLNSVLPSFMIPSTITTLDKLPLRAEGKIDISTLLKLPPPKVRGRLHGDSIIREELMEVAKELAAVFGNILDLSSYSVTDEFFGSGGQSLLLFRLLQLVNSQMNSDLSLSDILQKFRNLSPVSLASVVMERRSKEREKKDRIIHSSLMIPVQQSVSNNDFDYLAPVPCLVSTEYLQQLMKDKQLVSEEKTMKLKAETGINIPPKCLAQYPSAHCLQTQLKLKYLIQHFKTTSSPIIKLSSPSEQVEEEVGDTVIFLHSGVIGWSLSYLSLAHSLPVNAIIVQRCEQSPINSFQEMVEYYVNTILDVHCAGPYRLIGLCYGAMMVYEVARQLTDRGQTIELAVFINHSPAIEVVPRVFNSEGDPLPNTFICPIVFFRTILGLPLPIKEIEGATLEERVKKLTNHILSSPETSWIPFLDQELEDVYFGFYHRLKCAWRNYFPRPGAAINNCLLLRDSTHPLFVSHDFGLSSLLPSSTKLTVATATEKMGLMSDPMTFNFIKNQILSCLIPNSPTTVHSLAGLE